MRQRMAIGIESSKDYGPLTEEQRKNAKMSDWMIGLSEVMKMFGLTEDQLRSELSSGRLVAHGKPIEGDYTEVGIRADNLSIWMAATGRKIRDDY